MEFLMVSLTKVLIDWSYAGVATARLVLMLMLSVVSGCPLLGAMISGYYIGMCLCLCLCSKRVVIAVRMVLRGLMRLGLGIRLGEVLLRECCLIFGMFLDLCSCAVEDLCSYSFILIFE